MSLQATPLISTQHLGKSPSVFYGVPVSKYFANEFNYHITTRRKVSRKKDHNNFFKLYLPSPFERCKIIRCLHTPNRVATRQREIVRTRESEGDSASRKRLVFAYYVTGHGFGHATRVAEVVRNLILAGHYVHVVTGAPDFVFTSFIQSPRLFIRKTVLDCGAVQADALSADSVASLEKYTETAVKPRAFILATEREWLNFIKADLVVSDVVPVACRAAADAGIRSVCVTNFSWDFIYSDYVKVAGRHHRSIVRQITEDYSHCELLIRLPGYCPMPAFRDVIDAPLVVRRLNKSRKEIRSELGISEEVKLVILNFGGQPAGWKLKEEYLPEGWLCLVCGAYNSEELPPNFIKLVKDAYTPDFIAASDCMLGKIGYGTVSEALAYKVPFIFVRRENFNEEPFLRDLLEHYQGGVEMIREDFFAGHWKPYLEHAISLQPCYEGGTNGAEVAARILQETAIRKNYASDEIVEVMRRKAKLPTVDRVKGERSKVA